MKGSGTCVHQIHTVLHLKGKFTKFRNCSIFNRKKYHPIKETFKSPVGGGVGGERVREGERDCHIATT